MPIVRIRQSAERIIYRIAGLPIALCLLNGAISADDTDPLQSAFAWQFWHPSGLGDWLELGIGILTAPLAILLASTWYTFRNGTVIRRRYGKGIAEQFVEQLKLYFSTGLLSPWYYIFSLHEDGAHRAKTFIYRFETKRSAFPLLKPRKGSPLNDKALFARYCAERQLRCVETIMPLDGEAPGEPLPDRDLFIKPAVGRGGRGAERWDYLSPEKYVRPDGVEMSAKDLLAHLVSRSSYRPLIVQPRLHAHSSLLPLTAGALPTIRVLTCRNLDGDPEVMAAVLRMSIGGNRTVDNFHAGGIAALLDLDSGALSNASNLGSDARLGWLSAHPDTRAQIEGHLVPFWPEVKMLAIAAHRHFRDRVIVGWDIAVLDDGPMLIEGNGNPDLDILQRFMRRGLREHRFGALIAQHLKLRAQIMQDRKSLGATL